MEPNVKVKIPFFLFLSLCVHSIHSQTFEVEPLVVGTEEKFSAFSISDELISYANDLMDSVNVYKLNETDGNDLFFNAKPIQPFDLAKKKCMGDLMYIYDQLQQPSMGWAASMIDAFGKPESGILEGNLKWIGNYDECLKVYAPSYPKMPLLGNFKGKYCTLKVNVNLNENNSLPISIGTCIPDSCDPSFLPANLTTTNNGSLTMFSDISLTCLTTSKKFTSAAKGFTFLLSIFVLLAVLGSSITAYEFFAIREENCVSESTCNLKDTGQHERVKQEQEDDPSVDKTGQKHIPSWMEQCKPFLNCFCVFSNGEKLLNTDEVKGQMLSLHGIRFLSLVWVILCHVYSMCLSSIKNPVENLIRIDHLPFQIVLNGFYAVDSFFVLSGFLLAYLFFQQSEKTNGKIPWLYFYVHRYIRLTPVYMIVLGFYTCIYPLLGSGPLWPAHDIDPVCRRNWWWNLLYLNNLLSSPNSCMTFSWYLANDMQFFAISPLFLITLWRWPKIGFSLLALFTTVTFACNFGLTYHFQLLSGIGNIAAKGVDMKEIMIKWTATVDKLYVRPYTRMAPYLVGIALAYYLYKRKQRNSGKDNKNVLIIGWVVATAVTLTFQFSLYDRKLSVLEASFHNGFNHICFGCGIAWVIYVCLTGQAEIVNRILSFKAFLPFSRLTYCAYLVHPLVMSLYFGTMRDLLYFSHLQMIMIFVAVFILSYIAAFLTSLLFESPIIRLEKFVRTKSSSK